MKNDRLIQLSLESMCEDPNIHFSHFYKLLDVILSLFLMREGKEKYYYRNERLYFIDLLTQKFMLHGFSIKKLISGITLDSKSNNLNIPILDPFSIYSLIRTMIETYLVQNYLSNKTLDENLLNGRFEIWMRYGLIKRGTNDKILNAKKVLESDKRNIARLEESIKEREFFLNLSEEKKAKFLKSINSEWKFIFEDDKFFPVSWKRLLKEAEIKSIVYEETYNFLSWHAHSQSISILQLQDMWDQNFDKESIKSSIKQLNMYIAFMTTDIVLSDKNFKLAYNSLSKEFKELIDFNNVTFRNANYSIE